LVAEHTRDEHWHRDEGRVAGHELGNVLGQRKLGRIEFETPAHAVEDLPRIVDRNEGEIDAGGLHFARIERVHPIVEAGGERERNVRHEEAPVDSRLQYRHRLPRDKGGGNSYLVP
jgi:hypothetical protein